MTQDSIDNHSMETQKPTTDTTELEFAQSGSVPLQGGSGLGTNVEADASL